LEVEVFGGKWLDKVAAGAVSLVVLWPLVIIAGISVWKQNAPLNELYDEAVLFLARHADLPWKRQPDRNALLWQLRAGTTSGLRNTNEGG
jgi:hypothetical protein